MELATQQTDSSPAQRVGGALRTARERLGWSLPETAAYIRIRLPFLQAIEDGRSEALPAPVYVLGFVRSYSLALGVDPDEMVRRYQAETGAVQPKVKLDFPSPVPQRHVPAGTVVMLGVLVAVGAYVGWYRATGEHPITVAVQQVPARLAPLALPVVPPPPAHVAALVPPANPPEANVADIPYVPPSAAEAAIPAPVAAPSPAMAATAANTRIVLAATEDAWVQVKDADGKVVMSRLMHQGDTWPVPDQPAGLLLTTGNAGGTQLTVDGKPVPALGSPGAVRRDIALDPQALATPHA